MKRADFFNFKRISTGKLLLITYLLFLFPPLIAQIIVNIYMLNTYRDELIKSNTQQSEEFKLSIENTLQELLSISLTIYSDNEYVNILKKSPNRPQIEKYEDQMTFKRYISQFLYRSYSRGVFIYSENGEYYTSNANLANLNIDETLTKGNWIRSISSAKGEYSFLGTHIPGQLSGGLPVFSIARKIIDSSSGQMVGLMLIDIDPQIFGSIYKQMGQESKQVFVITDASGNIIYHYDNNMMMKKLQDPNLLPMYSSLSGTLSYEENNIKYIASYNTLKLSGWKLAVIAPLESVTQSSNMIRKTQIWIAAFSLLFALICSLFFSNIISKPVRRLTGVMKRAESGNLDVACVPGGTQDIFILGSGFNSMILKIRRLLKNEYELKLLKKDADFKALQAQINPHFLYNTLETISALADVRKIPEISRMCITLSNLFRYSIGTRGNIVPLSMEVSYLTDYFSIMKLRSEEELTLNINIDEKYLNYKCLKLVLQPLVENSIIHGFKNLDGPGIVTVTAKADNNRLIITIADNGTGICEEKLAEIRIDILGSNTIKPIIYKNQSTSIGLLNIHFRLSSFFGEQYGILDILSHPGEGTTIMLAIPTEQISGGYLC